MKHSAIRPSLDDLYGNRPDTRPRFRWPVTDSAGRPIEWFDDYFEAFDFVKLGSDRFIGEPIRNLGNDRYGVEA